MKKAECKFMSVKKPEGLSIQKAVNALRELDPELVPLLDAFQIRRPETGNRLLPLADSRHHLSTVKWKGC